MADEEYKKESEYLRESLRLAELLLEQQQHSDRINQNKTVLLITLCVSVFGYLHAAESVSMLKQCLPPFVWAWVNIILAGIFLIAVIYGILALNTAQWGVQGADTGYSSQFSGDFNLRAKTLLGNYEEYLSENQKVLDDKQKHLKISKRVGLAGVFCVFILVVAAADMCVYFPLAE